MQEPRPDQSRPSTDLPQSLDEALGELRRELDRVPVGRDLNLADPEGGVLLDGRQRAVDVVESPINPTTTATCFDTMVTDPMFTAPRSRQGASRRLRSAA